MNIFSLLKSKITNAGAHQVFLFFALSWGLFTVFLTPPIQISDEPNHFFRAYQISKGEYFPTAYQNRIGGFLPRSIKVVFDPFQKLFLDKTARLKIADFKNPLDYPLNKTDTTFLSFPNTARFIPIPYLPQATGIAIGRMFDAPPLVLFYLGRLVNFLVWTVLVFFALKIIPVYKWLFLIIALLPMSVFEAASLSADAFTNAISFFGIAFFLKYAFAGKTKIGNSTIVFMALVVLMISMSKSAYFLLVLLFFLIPKDKFATKLAYRRSAAIVLSSAIIGFIASALFVKMVYGLHEPGTPFFLELSETLSKVDTSGQFVFILSHPLQYSKVLLNTFWTHYPPLIQSCIGVLGWWDSIFPMYFYYLSILIFIFITLFETTGKINIRQKLIMASIALATILGLATTQYLTWTPVGKEIIDGLHGRYFIPILPLGLFLFSNQKLKAFENLIKVGAMGYVLLTAIITSYILHQRYWDFFLIL